MPKREIYLLSPRSLSPETIAVAFAKTSRSPDSFRAIAAELSDEKSAQFHEKWVVGYGHASVAEHAVLHIAFENVSRLAIESIEGNRLASYTEKSTRYQKWGPDDFTIPPELEGHPLCNEYMDTIRFLFQTYMDSLEPVRSLILERFPRRENEKDEAWDRRIRSKYVDVCRFILPAASLANVGMTANARVLENTIRKMLSHELEEVRQVGERVKEVALGETPTLVKYADAVPYLVETCSEIEEFEKKALNSDGVDQSWCGLIDYDKDGETKVLAAALYRFGEMSYAKAHAYIESLDEAAKASLAESLLGRLGKFDVPLRELEYSTYTFDLVMDQGAYAEFKRHRMMTQTPQRLTTRLGYATPKLFTEAGFAPKYEAAMNSAASLYEKLYSFHPGVAQYVVPNGFNRRVLAQFNLREAYAFCQLRSAANAHFSIRRIAQRVHEEMARVHPLLTKYMKLYEETWQGVEESYFTKV
ncbi:MAG TPA: FAD-dependent thymidylate synthase [Anaerolineales bacterium]|nr:FAD-dependent thymidylate synthase [Anaerolineales bacterium]